MESWQIWGLCGSSPHSHSQREDSLVPRLPSCYSRVWTLLISPALSLLWPAISPLVWSLAGQSVERSCEMERYIQLDLIYTHSEVSAVVPTKRSASELIPVDACVHPAHAFTHSFSPSIHQTLIHSLMNLPHFYPFSSQFNPIFNEIGHLQMRWPPVSHCCSFSEPPPAGISTVPVPHTTTKSSRSEFSCPLCVFFFQKLEIRM